MTKQLIKSIFLTLILSCSSASLFAQDILSKSLTKNLSVSGLMTTEKFSQLMTDGFKSVIVNRPDNESGNLVTVNELRDIAEKKHVGVIYQPVESGKITQKDITEFAQYYNELPKPILMICKSGTRSALLYNQAKTQGLLHE